MRATGSLGEPRHTLPEAIQIQLFSKPQAVFFIFLIFKILYWHIVAL